MTWPLPELAASSSAARIPFTLLGGYLGAGKTTLLNRLLVDAHGQRIAVLVNDVGAVNVDAALIADHDGETLELTNGCVCCAIADDFVTTLERVRAMAPKPDRVVMELSGVAEPARLVPWANTTGFRLDGVVVVGNSLSLTGGTLTLTYRSTFFEKPPPGFGAGTGARIMFGTWRQEVD